MFRLMDERSQPTLRERIGSLFATSTSVDIAVGSIHLAGVDLEESETHSAAHVRILLRRLVVEELAALGGDDAARLAALTAYLESGRVEIRSAGVAAWAPDFSIYRGAHDGDACIVGPHWFREPPIADGPTFIVLLNDPADVALASARFNSLWQNAHDVILPVTSAIRRRQSVDVA